MAEMTTKQMAFARNVASGLSLTQSYRESYNVGEHTRAETIRQLASRLMGKEQVRSMVMRLNKTKDAAVIATTVSDSDRMLTKLRHLLEHAEGTPAETVMLRAADLLGKTQGMYKLGEVTKVERSADDVRAELGDMLKQLGLARTTDLLLGSSEYKVGDDIADDMLVEEDMP